MVECLESPASWVGVSSRYDFLVEEDDSGRNCPDQGDPSRCVSWFGWPHAGWGAMI